MVGRVQILWTRYRLRVGGGSDTLIFTGGGSGIWRSVWFSYDGDGSGTMVVVGYEPDFNLPVRH